MSEPQQPSKAKGCLKYSCLGCLIIVGVPAVILTVVVLIGLAVGVPDPERVTTETARDLPVISPLELPQEGALGTETALPSIGRGRIELDVSTARIDVVRGEPGEKLRLEADYDNASFELEEEFVESADGWTYKLTFATRLGWFRTIFKRNPARNELTLVVPEGVPFSLSAGIAVGESNLELGGLSVSTVDVAYGPGSHRVTFDEPLPQPAERIELVASVGDLRLGSLGNASPARATVIHSVGEARVDLTGAWARDAVVSVTQSVGDLRIEVPENVHIEVSAEAAVGSANLRGLRELQARQAEDPLPEGAPTLRLTVTKSVGDLRIH